MRAVSKAAFAAAVFFAAALVSSVQAADISVEIRKLTATGTGESLGRISFRDNSELGLLIIPDLQGLDPGVHGLHVHEHPDCGSQGDDGKRGPGQAAGGHYDPEGSGRHAGPVGEGHLGDLPALVVGPDGTARMAMFAPRLQVTDLIDRAVMVHAGGDNYADEPEKLGGGGSRVACGVVELD